VDAGARWFSRVLPSRPGEFHPESLRGGSVCERGWIFCNSSEADGHGNGGACQDFCSLVHWLTPKVALARSARFTEGASAAVCGTTETWILRTGPQSAYGPAAYSERRRAKRIAGGDGALLEPGREPALALLRGTVGEGIRHHAPCGLALQRVVTHCRGRA
jgi:hypothetical protein